MEVAVESDLEFKSVFVDDGFEELRVVAEEPLEEDLVGLKTSLFWGMGIDSSVGVLRV